uniref:ESPR-type extended signal peptide-containing protein n=1 Tax=Dialister succinatiphilus TaxID=487173 RepID=UPI003AB685E0
MNRVYKVIWSKAKHCYVVTSEIAKNHTKGESTGRGLRKLAAALLVAAALMGPNFAWAADPTVKVTDTSGVEQIVYTKDGADVNFATKTDLDAKANVDKDGKVTAPSGQIGLVEITSTGAVSGVTDLTVSGNVEAGGNLKVGNGNFTVNGITGDVTTGYATIGDDLIVKGDTEMKGDLGVNGNIKTNRGFIQTGGGNINTQGGALRTNGGNINAGNGTITGNKLTDGVASLQNGNLTTTGNINTSGTVTGGTVASTGNISAVGDIHAGNAISGASASIQGALTAGSATITGDLNAGGAIQGKSISDGTATMKNGDITGVKNLSAETITTHGDLTVNGKLNMDEIDMTKVGIVGDNNVTASTRVAAGEITSYKKATSTKDGSEKESSFDYDENGTSTWAKATDADGKKNKSTLTVEGKGIKSIATDGKINASTNLSNKGFNTFASDGGKNKTYTKQTAESLTSQIGDDGKVQSVMNAEGISNNADGGTITNSAKDLVNTATENMTNTVGGNLTTTVTGDSSLTAENITNEAKNKITNKAIDVETDATSSIVQNVTNDAGSNTSTQWSYQTKEEMSQTDGKTAFYLRGAAEEKSQLTDGSKTTTIDTIAGKTNTNITEGKNISNSLQEADQIASSVTDGTNKTVVNQNAGSLASSITAGTKFNNTNNTVDKSEQLIKVDDTRFYAETKTVGKAEEALKSGNTVIDIVKDATTATVSSAVFDGATITGISQNAKDISLSAAGGTITNDANDVLNKGTNSVINEVDANQVAVMTDSVKAAYGSDTYTTWDDKGITSNTSGNMSNTVGGKMLNNVTGDMENEVGGNLTNSAVEIENKASSSIWNHVGEGYNTSWKMTNGKISESIVNGTASNKENTTAEGTKRIITSEEGTGTYNQTATSNNISLKNKAGDTSFTKSESLLKGEKTSVTNPNGSSTINQSAESIVNFVKNTEGHATKTEQSAEGITNTAKNGTITNDAKIVKTITGKNKVISDNGGTTFENEAHSTAVKDGTVKKTTISGNTIETGQATMDYADVTKDLSVGHNATVENDLTVKGTSEFVGRADFRYDVYVDNNLTVAKETRTDTLYVDHDGYVGGNLNVAGNIETHDAVLSADSRQVVTGRQLYQTNERVDRLDNRIKKVGANAAALAALRPGDFNPDDKFSIAAGFGSYRNANAAALGLFYRPNENVLLSLGTSFGDGENMVNAGVSVKFGRGKSMAERRKEMADEVSSMRDEMRSQDERIAEL